MIDRWTILGLPLIVLLTNPSSSEADPLAATQTNVVTSSPNGVSPNSQQEFVQRVVSLLLAKPAVQGILWNQLHDAVPHEFAHAGLFDADGGAKPALTTLAELRSAHLV